MSSESELRARLRSSANITTTGIDTDAVLRKVRTRRVPKQLAFSSLSVLAVVGVAAFGITTLPSLLPGENAASDTAMMATAPESAQGDAPGESQAKFFDARLASVNFCGMPTIMAGPDPSGLTLAVNFPDSPPAGGAEVVGTVSLTNSGTVPVSGTTAPSPTITVSRDGTTVWHSHGEMATVAMHVSLDPGQSYFYDTYFTPVECGPEDEVEGQFRDTLPPLVAGAYAVSAELLFVPDDADAGESILVGGPPKGIVLR